MMRSIRGWFFLADLWFSRKLLPGDPDIENNQIASQKSKKNISMHYYQFLRCYFFSLTFEKKIDPSIFQRGYISIKISILVNSRHSFKAKLTLQSLYSGVGCMGHDSTPFMSWQWQSWSIDFRTFPFFYELVKITLLLSMYFLSIELTLVSITGHLKAR